VIRAPGDDAAIVPTLRRDAADAMDRALKSNRA
jgi:hypothetical protein